MPKRRSLFFLLPTLCSAALGQTSDSGACLVPPARLVSWWPGDSNENDIVGTNNPTQVNAVSLVPAEVQNGFTFGTNGYIQIAQSPSLMNQRFTWAVWARPDGHGPDTSGFMVNQNIDANDASVSLGWRGSDSRFTFTVWGSPRTVSRRFEATKAFG